MRLFNWQKKKQPEVTIPQPAPEPSPEQTLFTETVMDIIGKAIKPYGFVLRHAEVKTFSANIVYGKGQQYIRLHSTTFPTNYPYYFGLLLGVYDSNPPQEADWNSVPLWAIADIINPDSGCKSYDFPDEEQMEADITVACNQLLQYGDNFLQGDTTIFSQALKEYAKQQGW